MPNRMERFSQRARRVLSLAQEAALAMHSAWIDTDHLLIGLLNEADGAAARTLRALGVDASEVANLARQQSKARPRSPAHPDLSAECKRTLEFAVDEARRLGHNYIGTEHLLLGLCRLEKGAALDILRKLNVSREQIRRKVVAIMQTRPAPSPPPDPPLPARESPVRLVDYFLLRMTSRSSGEVSHFAVDLSPAVKDALEEALKEVAHSGYLQLDERHLLLGLILSQDGELRRLLLGADFDLDALILQLREHGNS